MYCGQLCHFLGIISGIAASNIHLIRNYETFHARMLSADVIQAASSI